MSQEPFDIQSSYTSDKTQALFDLYGLTNEVRKNVASSSSNQSTQ